YHLTDLLIFVANGALLCAFARRLFGPDAWLAGLFAALVFVLHPIQLETLPVPPRRADSLCLSFTLACLLSLGPAGAPRAALRRALGAAFALLAAGSKETGALAAPLAFGLAFLRAPLGAAAERARGALRDSGPPLASVALYAAARSAVLGGWGGHRNASLASAPDPVALVKPYLERLFAPQAYEPGGPWIAALALAALLLAAYLAWRPPRRAEARRLRSGLAFALLWFACLIAIHSLADRASAWYTTLFVAPYAIFLGVLTQCGVALLREGRAAPAALALVFSLGLAGSHLRYSSLLVHYPEWPRASAAADAFLDRFERRVRRAELGSTLRFRRFPTGVERSPTPPGIRSAVVLSDYSLQAWADLVMPDHPVRVHMLPRGASPPAPDAGVVTVILHPGVAALEGAAARPPRDASPQRAR
ncbi:MAG TPA: hypothetical protein VIY27_01060, partial [Myxococcota bacterium]